MSSPNVATVDALNSLLEAEVNSIFHFVGEGSPYLKSANAEIRKILEGIRRELDRHEHELSELIRHLGGQPSMPPKPDPNDQYLSYLSLKFLLPKLVDAKKLMIERYDHALGAVGGNAEAVQLLQQHMTEMREALAVLQRVAKEVSPRG